MTKENKKMKKVAIATVTTLVSLSSTVMVNALDADNDIAQQSIQEEGVQGVVEQDIKQGWSIEDGKKYYYNEWGFEQADQLPLMVLLIILEDKDVVYLSLKVITQ